jgi:hypothetical protein
VVDWPGSSSCSQRSRDGVPCVAAGALEDDDVADAMSQPPSADGLVDDGFSGS